MLLPVLRNTWNLDSLKGFILAQLNIRGIKFREYFGLKFANFLKMANLRKLIPQKINSTIYLPKNISEMVQKSK